MKISVIIPVYNEEKEIKDCLESLTNQSFPDLEVIIVDDGSKDKSIEIVSDFKETAQLDLQILNQDHRGAGAARNLGVKHAMGEILVFVDADMTFAEDFVEKLVAPIVTKREIGTFSKEERLGNQDNVWARCWNINRGLPETKMHPDNYPDTQKVFRAILASEFKKAGGFNEKGGYTDDYSLSERLGKEAVNAPGAVFYHKNPDSLGEVFRQSKWMAKRKYKLGFLGYLAALLRVSLPVSKVLGIIGAVMHLMPAFFVFKIVSDLGQFLGILEFSLKGKVSK